MHVTKYLKKVKGIIGDNPSGVYIQHKYNTLTITDGVSYLIEIQNNEAPEFYFSCLNENVLLDGVSGEYLFTTLDRLNPNLPTRVLPDYENNLLIFDQGEEKHTLHAAPYSYHCRIFFEAGHISDNFDLKGEALENFTSFLANVKGDRLEFETSANYDGKHLWYYNYWLTLKDGENTLKIKPSLVSCGGQKSVVTGKNIQRLLKLCQSDITKLDVDVSLKEGKNLWRVAGFCEGDGQDYDARFFINFEDVLK